MLDHLRQKAAQTIATVNSVVLSSYGPADIQSSRVACTARDLVLYIFIPGNSEHLLNVESHPEVVITTEAWDLHGTARILAANEVPECAQPGLSQFGTEAPFVPSTFSTRGGVVEITPTRLTLHASTGLGNTETIDF